MTWAPITNLEQLVARFESSALDYKTTYDLMNKGTRCEIAKDVAAFANAFGGAIVVGVVEAGGRAVKLDGVPNLPKLQEEVATALQLHCVPLTPGPEEHEIWVSPEDAPRLLAPGCAAPVAEVRLVALNVRPDPRGPIGVRQLDSSGGIFADVYRFPLRVTDQTRFLDPTELPMWMNSHERRIAIQLRQVAEGAQVRAFHVLHDVRDGDARYLAFERVDEHAMIAVFRPVEAERRGEAERNLAHVPLSLISSVWQEPNKVWAVKIEGTLFPNADAHLGTFRPRRG